MSEHKSETLGTCERYTYDTPHTKMPGCVNWKPLVMASVLLKSDTVPTPFQVKFVSQQEMLLGSIKELVDLHAKLCPDGSKCGHMEVDEAKFLLQVQWDKLGKTLNSESDTVPTEAAKPKCPTGHANMFGHEWSSTCQDCGETWQHRAPEYVASTGKFADPVAAKGEMPRND